MFAPHPLHTRLNLKVNTQIHIRANARDPKQITAQPLSQQADDPLATHAHLGRGRQRCFHGPCGGNVPLPGCTHEQPVAGNNTNGAKQPSQKHQRVVHLRSPTQTTPPDNAGSQGSAMDT